MESRLNWTIGIILGWVIWWFVPWSDQAPVAFLGSVVHLVVVFLTIGWFNTLVYRYLIPEKSWQMHPRHWALLSVVTLIYVASAILGYRGDVALLHQVSSVTAFGAWIVLALVRMLFQLVPESD